jgi:hypothetical protein
MARSVVTDPHVDPLDRKDEVKALAQRAGFARPYGDAVNKALDAVEHVERKRTWSSRR